MEDDLAGHNRTFPGATFANRCSESAEVALLKVRCCRHGVLQIVSIEMALVKSRFEFGSRLRRFYWQSPGTSNLPFRLRPLVCSQPLYDCGVSQTKGPKLLNQVKPPTSAPD